MFDAVLVISFGGPQGPEDIRPFLANVLRGRRVSPERIEEVARHYEIFGGVSPITSITRQQANGLQTRLHAAGYPLPVHVGMRNWHPYLADTLREMHAAGVRRAIGFIAAAQHSYSSCQQYRENVAAARAELRAQGADVEVTFVGSWFDHPGFIDANAAHVREAVARLSPELREAVRLVCTAHSIPAPMAARSRYEAQLRESSRLVAEAAGIVDWVLVYQSRSGRPEDPWLGPDVCHYLRSAGTDGLRAAVLCPIGFVCDHIEVLYDLDREAAAVCAEIGLPMVRADSANDDPRFLDMMADMVLRTIRRHERGWALPHERVAPPVTAAPTTSRAPAPRLIRYDSRRAMMRISRFVSAVATGAAVAAYMVGPAHVMSRAQAPARPPVTFTEHVAPIVFANCTTCHRPGEAAPFSLLSYRDARPLARALAAAAVSRAMPPWKPASTDYPFHDARGLTVAQIETLQRWAADGAPEGDPAKLPPLPRFTDGWQLGPPDLVVSMVEPYEVPARGPDQYRNFVVPLNLDRDVWVRAIDFRPSARAVVHHSLFFLDSTGSARELDAGDPAPGFPGGMGGVRIGGAGRGALARLMGRGAATAPRDEAIGQASGSLGGWALGGRALELPEGLAFPVARGSDLILSTHFHPSGASQTEKSTIGLYFASRPPTQAFTAIQLPPVFGVFEGLDIPAGQERYTIKDSFTLPVDVRAFSVGAHAHYLGKEMKLTAAFPDGSVRTLFWITDWDFSWQERYRFKDFVALPKGTRLDVEISYDNSAANRRNPSRPPVRVTWGEESNDEMGSVGLQLVAARPGDLPELQRAYAEFVRNAALTRPGLRRLLQERFGGRGLR